MNFDEAIQVHASWKMKLSRYIREPNGSLQAAEVGRDKVCPLGCWKHKDGLKYSALPEFTALKREHVLFHRTAAAAVNSIMAMKRKAA